MKNNLLHHIKRFFLAPIAHSARRRAAWLAPILCMMFLSQTQGSSSSCPLKVFILCGQSNMQGHAQVRTLDHIGMDPKTAPILKEMRSEDGALKVSDQVWISYLSSDLEKSGKLTAGFGASDDKIGPEWTFGIYMEKALQDPILIIKTAWGGKSLNTDFRSPSAGPYVFDPQQVENFKKQGKDFDAIQAEKDEATGHYYRLTTEYVKKVLSDIKSVYPDYDPKQGYELAGFVWFQGWNDMVDRGAYPNRDQPGGYDAYTEVMGHFIRDIRKDLASPKMPFVIGVIGVGGPVSEYKPDQLRYKDIHQNIRWAMAAPAQQPEFQNNVKAVLTENYWDQELTDLRSRQSEMNAQFRKIQSDKNLSKSEIESAQEKLRKETFTDQEWLTLQTGVSNAEYHYLGSSKIMAQIGKGFAEAMVELMQSK